MSNSIAQRVFDFLVKYPPFSFFDPDPLMQLSKAVNIKYYEAGEIIFEQESELQSQIFVVKDGAVALFRKQEDEERLVDVCDEGDVFGLRPFLADQTYYLTSRTEEETLIYAIDVKQFMEVIEQTPAASWFLAQSFAAGVRNIEEDQENQGRLLLPFSDGGAGVDSLAEVQELNINRTPVSCSPIFTIQAAAQVMSAQRVGSIIVVNEDHFPLGIVTNKDLGTKVATGQYAIEAPITSIMSSPVITAPPQLTISDAQMVVLDSGVRHLVITEDGTDQSRLIGVISQHDLLVSQGNQPAALLRGIRRGRELSTLNDIRMKAEGLLEKYIHQEVSIAFISKVMTKINDTLIRRVIQLSEQEMAAEGYGKPPVEYCFMALGSAGREEQLLRTDQDNAIVFEDVAKVELEETKKYFLKLAEKINHSLLQCGFDYCPADMMAKNPSWCLPLSGWKAQFSEWILEPTLQNILYCSIFFDYRPIWGNSKLTEALSQHIFQAIENQTVFLAFLAKSAVENPAPLSFFRGFMVERSGEHKNEFDIKKRAMMPLADAARVLILKANVPSVNNTFKRFDTLAELEPQNREVYEQAADAYEILIRYRTLQGLKQKNSGRYFSPSNLTKMQRMTLKNCFRPIRELQNLLSVRFQLGFIR